MMRWLTELSEDVPVYVVALRTDAAPPTIDVSDYPGLLAAHVLAGTPTEIVCYWRSLEHYEAQRTKLLRVMHGASEVTRRHVASTYSVRRRRSPWTMLLAAVAVLGTLEGLRAHHDWLFFAPQLSLSPARAGPLDLHESSPLSETFHLANYTLQTHDAVAIQRVQIAPQVGELNITVIPSSVRSLNAGERVSVVVNGDMPPPGRYSLQFELSSSAGLLRGSKIQTVRFPISVWADVPSVTWKQRLDRGRKTLLNAELENGRSTTAAVNCVMTLVNHPEVTLAIPSGTELEVRRTWESSPPPNTVGTLRIGWPPRPEFTRTRFQVAFTSVVAADWNAVQRDLSIDCSYAPKGSDT